MPVSILDARTQAAAWSETLRKAGCADVYFTPAYALSFNGVDDGAPLLFVFEDRRGLYLYPFRERELTVLPGLETFAGRRDIVSNYGYGGPLACVARAGERGGFVEDALDAFDAFCRERGVVSEFCRFHPLLGNAEGVRRRYRPALLNQTVWIDLERSEEDIQGDMRANIRRGVRKALRDGLVVMCGRDEDMARRFHALYAQSMRHVGAARRYLFDEPFFLRLLRLHAGQASVCLVFRGDAPVAGTLCIWGGSDAHAHFSGLDRSQGESHAGKLAHYAAIMDCRRRGLKRFHFGGGYGGSDDDSLMRFKAGFSPLRAAYHVGRRVHDQAAFLAACAAAGTTPERTDFFPAYRAPGLGAGVRATPSAVGEGRTRPARSLSAATSRPGLAP